jgi:hypothetical protein
MYIIEKRVTSNMDDYIYESTEVVKSAYIENEHFEDAIKKEIDKYQAYGFMAPVLKESEILRFESDDRLYRWFMWDYQEDMDPFIFKASASQPDDFTDTVLNVKKWIKEIEENGYKAPRKRETKNSEYIIA